MSDSSDGCEWRKIGVDVSLVEKLVSLSFPKPMPVQSAVIPLFLTNKDVVVEAITGSGKTLAFLIPIVQKLRVSIAEGQTHRPFSLVIAPTRDLAAQICTVLKSILPDRLRFSLLLGGKKTIEQNMKNYRGKEGTPPHIIVATPGRLAELINASGLSVREDLKNIQILILDEADRILDLGFTERIADIMDCLPKQRRTGLFSATQTDKLEDIIRAGLRNPVRITVHDKQKKDSRTPKKLKNFYTVAKPSEKLAKLLTLLKKHHRKKFLLFFATAAQVNYFRQVIGKFISQPIVAMHGRMKRKRSQILDKFKKMESGVMISTDLFARGMDVEDIDWVVQFDAPCSAANFVHRCGRTARADREGRALLILMPNETEYVEYLRTSQKAVVSQMTIHIADEFKDTVDRMRQLALDDREYLECGSKAFVSYIQAYKKHECSFIFNTKTLDFGDIGNGFGLLRLPRMVELGRRNISAFVRTDCVTRDIKFADPEKEKRRIEGLDELGERVKQNKIDRLTKVTKKKKKKKMIMKNRFTYAEVDEICEDARLLKKQKKGKADDDPFDDLIKSV